MKSTASTPVLRHNLPFRTQGSPWSNTRAQQPLLGIYRLSSPKRIQNFPPQRIVVIRLDLLNFISSSYLWTGFLWRSLCGARIPPRHLAMSMTIESREIIPNLQSLCISRIYYASREKVRGIDLPAFYSTSFLGRSDGTQSGPQCTRCSKLPSRCDPDRYQVRHKGVWECGGNSSTNSRELLSVTFAFAWLHVSVGFTSCPRRPKMPDNPCSNELFSLLWSTA